MKKTIYAIHDSAVGAYMQPFFMRSDNEARRAFREVVNDPQTNIHQTPGDYTLFAIGEYDESKGKLKPYRAMKSLGNALDYLEEKPQIHSLPPQVSENNVAMKE